MMSCTVVTRRKFDPETTLELIDRNRATGLSLVPVMFDRIMGLPTDVLDRYMHLDVLVARVSGNPDPAPFWDGWARLKQDYDPRLPA